MPQGSQLLSRGKLMTNVGSLLSGAGMQAGTWIGDKDLPNWMPGVRGKVQARGVCMESRVEGSYREPSQLSWTSGEGRVRCG